MRIHFEYDSAKATQAVLWLLHRHGGAMNKLKLVKLVFFADREHLRQYGRPIVGGDYRAMPHGPVSSELLDVINRTVSDRKGPFVAEGRRVVANAPLDEDVLSESEVEVLEDVDRNYGKHDGLRLRSVTHQLRAWRQNYPEGARTASVPLPYEDFFLDLDDDRMLDIIREDQEAKAFFE